MACVDYGAVVFKDGVVQNENQFFMDMNGAVGWEREDISGGYFAFVGDEHLTLAFYKNRCHILVNKETFAELWGLYEDYRPIPKSRHLTVGNTNLHFRFIGDSDRVLWLTFYYRGNHYDIVYGYGIDSKFSVWDRVKIQYLGKRLSRKVDLLYGRIRRNARYYSTKESN